MIYLGYFIDIFTKARGIVAQYYSNQEIESRFVISVLENHFVPIFIRFEDGDFFHEIFMAIPLGLFGRNNVF